MRKIPIIIAGMAMVAVAGTAFALKSYVSTEADQVAQPVTPTAANQTVSGQSASGCGSSGCGSSAASGGCCGSGAPVSADAAAKRLKSIEEYIQQAYAKQLGDPGITVEVKDFGCHQEASVLQKGKVIKRLSINGNRITETG